MLPTEAEFEEIFGVSRITARRALAELAAKGLVKRQAGIGTMVISTSEKQEVKARIRLVDGQQQHPIERNNLKLEQLVPPGVAQAFELNDDKTPLWLLTRTIYRQNEQPAQVNYIWLTTRLQHLTLDALKNGLYSMLENNNENIESFRMLLPPRCPRKTIVASCILILVSRCW
ncbi:GntR family transcriptional regulator [Klebsiella pneumoniae]|uniref:GntR family transcriptional regulator n=1 Tax=Klebsiella pneumoniae TaxID=573 RepID=UPI0022EA4379|nr:GntR family transcriptional regulator [Klebsiella pneumoniae]